MPTKKELLDRPIQHLDIKQHNVVPLVDAMHHMAYSARDTARAANIYDMMLRDTDCGVILCLAGSLISAGLQKIFVDLIRNNMVDAIVSTGANIVDQDFFEALGFNHYIAGDEYKYGAGDADLRELMIDRIYDTFIDEEELRICDETTHQITNSLEPRPYSSREFIREMGAYLAKNGKTPQAGGRDSIVLAAYEKNVPIFCPAFSDCSAGFGLVAHQHERQGKPHGLHRLRQGLLRDHPAQDRQPHHRPAHDRRRRPQELRPGHRRSRRHPRRRRLHAQVRHPDHRSRRPRRRPLRLHPQGSQFSWGKVDLTYEQMVFSEATLALPLIAGYAFHKNAHAARTGKKWATILDQVAVTA